MSNSSAGYGPSNPPYQAPSTNAIPPTTSYYGAQNPWGSLWSSLLSQMGVPTQGLYAQGMQAPQAMSAAQSQALSPTANQPALNMAIQNKQTGRPGQFPTMAAYSGMAPTQDPNTNAAGNSLYWGGQGNSALWGGGFPGMNYTGYSGPKGGTGPGTF